MNQPSSSQKLPVSDREPVLPESAKTVRRPGELAFVCVIALISLVCLWEAYGIAGFTSPSSPGAIPMFASAVMLVTAGLIAQKTWIRPANPREHWTVDILPRRVVMFVLLLVGYGLALNTVGFIPTSLVFLVIAIRVLSKRSWFFATLVGGLSLLLIWLIFRIVFTVLMPEGIVPEAELIQLFRNLLSTEVGR
jgi:putative tricarboxylic transport membrane protein